jgi:hypothetical protein
MYEVDHQDEVHELPGVPQSSIGAPVPIVVADEHRVVLAYYLEDTETDAEWDGQTIRVVGPADASEPLAIVRFAFCYAHIWGPPNDEAFRGHPLTSRGLHPYGAFEVRKSSWIRGLERMNSVHPYHRPEAFWKRRHLIFAFHDTTFECVCDGFDVTLSRGSVASAVPQMLKLLDWDTQ